MLFKYFFSEDSDISDETGIMSNVAVLYRLCKELKWIVLLVGEFALTSTDIECLLGDPDGELAVFL